MVECPWICWEARQATYLVREGSLVELGEHHRRGLQFVALSEELGSCDCDDGVPVSERLPNGLDQPGGEATALRKVGRSPPATARPMVTDAMYHRAHGTWPGADRNSCMHESGALSERGGGVW
ncbi:hypothetical protein Prum_070450 [Phytohabitans rumicis]|uniref:Uncharacterized protein n=1 Tax=Phytohabitans rumicis TaxID=1076125 RepID=A0A6V8L817_9ACTN|nr:hypothetical protein Prum_070450 [Phytohabitans rumicis]